MLLRILLGCLLLLSCSGEVKPAESQGPTPEEVERIYNLFLQGRYEDYVAEMASCDSVPGFYRQQMVDLFKQHAFQQKERNGGAIKATVERMDVTPSAQQANVFLRVYYQNQTHEVVMLPMVKIGQRWRLE